MGRIELPTSFLPRKRSTTELHRQTENNNMDNPIYLTVAGDTLPVRTASNTLPARITRVRVFGRCNNVGREGFAPP